MLNDPLQVKLFSFDAQQLVQSHENAVTVIQVGEDEGDVVNEVSVTTSPVAFLRTYGQICLSDNQKTLAFTMDSGTVGVVDLATKSIQRMTTQHNSVSLKITRAGF
jgi:hypothetical protein